MGYEAAVGDSMVPCKLTETPHASGPASKLAPTDHATKPPWEACWQANHQRAGGIRGQLASQLPTEGGHGTAVGIGLGREWGRRYEFTLDSLASQLPTEGAMEPLWEAALAANGAGDMNSRWIRWQASFPRKGAMEPLWESALGREFASKLVSHGFSTRPLWEACLQANVPTPKGENSPASWSPTAFLQGRCGKLACKRMRQRRGGIRQQAGLPRLFYKAAVGSLLASALAIRLQASFPRRLRGLLLWEAALAANAPSGRWQSACKQVSHGGFVVCCCGKRPWPRMLLRVVGNSLASKSPTVASWFVAVGSGKDYPRATCFCNMFAAAQAAKKLRAHAEQHGHRVRCRAGS